MPRRSARYPGDATDVVGPRTEVAGGGGHVGVRSPGLSTARRRHAAVGPGRSYVPFVVTVGLVALFALQPLGDVVALVAFFVAAGVATFVVAIVVVRAGRGAQRGRTVVSVEVTGEEMRALLDRRGAAGEESTWRG